MILQDIVEHKRLEVESSKKQHPLNEIKSDLDNSIPAREFYTPAMRTEKIKIISEIKKASPSRGVIAENFDPVDIARGYELNGAFAISVLTDSKFFMGSLDYLRAVKSAVNIPVLRKDFTIDTYQIYESRYYGADIILLIVSILDSEEIREFSELASQLGMDAIVEVHDEKELETALDVDSRIIGINNRDLRTFNVDTGTTERLAKMVPEDVLVISESGLGDPSQILRLHDSGISTFLIGETFMKTGDPPGALRELMNSLKG